MGQTPQRIISEEMGRLVVRIRSYKKYSLTKVLQVEHIRQDSFTELHGFSDASIKAFSAAIYMRFKTEFGCMMSLVTSKT